MMQIFFMCAFGQQIITQSESLVTKFYHSDWPETISDDVGSDWNRKIRKISVIFMEVLNKERQIVIGVLFPLSLRTFTSVSSTKTQLLLKRFD